MSAGAASATAAVELSRLRHVYAASRNTPERVALDGVSLRVAPGELFGLLGPNGGGKTTLCRILCTSLRPASGRVELAGADVVGNPAAARERIGVVFQYPSLDRKLTVRENLLHQGHLYGMSGAELARRAEEMLGRVGLSDRAQDVVEGLSGGMRRRVELAKGLLHKPSVIILDEPSTGLDPGARIDLWRYLGELKEKEGVTILVATHLMEEAERCDRLAILDHGRIVAQGTPDELKAQIGGDVIRIQSGDPSKLSAAIRNKFGVEAKVVEGELFIDRSEGHTFIPQLVEAFPGQITSIALGKPTLEDVFMHKTNHRFWAQKL